MNCDIPGCMLAIDFEEEVASTETSSECEHVDDPFLKCGLIDSDGGILSVVPDLRGKDEADGGCVRSERVVDDEGHT